MEGGWGAAMMGSNLTNGVADVVDDHFVSVKFGYLLRDCDGGQVSDLTCHDLLSLSQCASQ